MKLILSILAVCLIPCWTAQIASAQLSLEDLETRWETPMGATVVAQENASWVPYRYNGEVYGQLLQVPDAQREQAAASFRAQFGLEEGAEKNAVMLLTMRGNQPVIVDRKTVYPVDEATKLDPQGIAALGLPPQARRVVLARQVPWEIATDPAYIAKKAQERSEQAAVMAILLLSARASTAREGDPSCNRQCVPAGTDGVAVARCICAE